MNSIVLVIRLIVGIAYCLLSVRMFKGKYVYAGWASVLIGLVILFPVARLLYKRQPPLPAAAVKADFHAFKILSWIRKGLAVLFCVTVVGAFQRGKYEVGVLVFILCMMLLTPLDAVIFGNKRPLPPSQMRQHNWRDVLIVLGRNTGLILYVTGIFIFIDYNNTSTAIAFLVTGMVLLWIRPVVLLLAPYKIAVVPALEKNDEVTTTTALPESNPVQDEPNEQAQQALKVEYGQLLQLPPQQRGYAFQRFLTKLFTVHHMAARGAFRLTGEEIDGSFELGPQTYLLEAKWQAKPCGQSDLMTFNSKVEGKSTWARGIFISYAGFTPDGLKAFAHGKRTSIIGMDGHDIQLIVEGLIPLEEAIKRKARKAVENNGFFVPLAELL